jgi:type IV pilus assembly protein PilY1
LLATSGNHIYFQDGSPVAADVKISGTWKTIVVFGERRGGPYYHALDVTDTTAPKYLWSFTDSKISETWSTPVIGKVQVSDGSGGTVDKYVAFFGGGYDTASNNAHGKAVFAVDVATGSILWQYYYSTGATDDRKYMNFSIAADPLTLDLNSDGYVDRLYIGDVGGQLWKFDLSAVATLSGGTSGTVTNWTGKRLFAATPSQANPPATGEYYPAQAIYGAANAAYDTSSNLWIYFGTGDRNHPNNSSTNRFYGIKDNTDMTNASYLAESNLTDITTTNASTIAQGWFIQMATYEKIVAAPTIFNSIVYFTSFTYTSTTTCGSGGGTAKLYAVQLTTGYAAINWSTGAGYTSSSNASNTRWTTIGSGIPSEPVIVITDSGTSISASVIAATTNQQISSNVAPPPNTRKKILYWKENFQ